MNRREALSAVSLLVGGTIVGAEFFLSGCKPGNRQDGLLSTDLIGLLDEVANTILPDTPDSPGAKAAGVGSFMNVFVTDCYSEEEQKIFTAGLASLQTLSKTQYGDPFADLGETDRVKLLLGLDVEAKAQSPGQPPHYYMMIKQLTLLGYFTSEIGETKALRHVAVPGRWDPCIPLEKGQKAWG